MIDPHKFIFAGSAIFTLTDTDNDRHYTYRINKREPNPHAVKHYQSHGGPFKPATVWFVALGIGYDNSIYAGMLKSQDDTGVTFTKSSRVTANTPSMQLLNQFICMAVNGAYAERDTVNGIRFQHEGKCCMCARPLTNPQSIDLGIGPECAGKLGG